jgi:tetrahydromethanopterin S-methyltransferase subunit B
MSEQESIVERLAKLEEAYKNIEKFMIRLEAKIDAYQQSFVPRTELNEMFKGRDKQIEKVEDNQTWLWRAVIGGVASLGFGILLLWIKGDV